MTPQGRAHLVREIARIGLRHAAATAGLSERIDFILCSYFRDSTLAYVGVTMLFARKPMIASDLIAARAGGAGAGGIFGTEASAGAVFRRGFLTNVLNPKVALFFLAFVPQFIAAGTSHAWAVFLALGLLFTANGLAVCAGWALVAAWAARRAGVVRRGMHAMERVAGAVFVAFGVRLALTDSPAAP